MQVAGNGASGLTNLDRLGTAAYWQQTALNATAQGALAKVQGGRFRDGFTGSVIGSLSATGAGIIGDTTTGLPAANVVAHAALGCASAAASGKDCTSGALGGATSALVAPIIDSALADSDLSDAAQRAIIAGGSVSSSIAVASAVGKDAITAGNAAANEVTNNFLKHGRPEYYAKRIAKCGENGGCVSKAIQDAQAESAENIAELKSALGDERRVAEIRGQIEVDPMAYSLLSTQVGPEFQNLATLYADLIDNCAGKCGWLEGFVAKTLADGATNAAYGALGTGALVKTPPTSRLIAEGAGTGANSETALFKNLRPSDPIRSPSTQTIENIQQTGQSGRFNYVVTEDGSLTLGRSGPNRPNGHIDLAQGQDVVAAGEAKFVNGKLQYVDNMSGHYKPSGNSAMQAALTAFEKYGVRPINGYIERKFP